MSQPLVPHAQILYFHYCSPFCGGQPGATHALTRTHKYTHTLSLSRTHPISLTHIHQVHTRTLTHTHTSTHTHTHSLSLMYTPNLSLTHTPLVCVFFFDPLYILATGFSFFFRYYAHRMMRLVRMMGLVQYLLFALQITKFAGRRIVRACYMCGDLSLYSLFTGAGPSTCVCMKGFYFPRYCCISFNIVCVRVFVPRLAPTPLPVCYCCISLNISVCMCVFILARVSTSVLGTCCFFTTTMGINELRESSNVTGWKCPLVGKQNVTQRSRV